MNLIIIKGRLVRDPELKTTQSGLSVCTITVAVNRSYSKDKEKEADFFNCEFWRTGAEFVSKYFTKGQEILIHGEMQSRKYTDKNGNDRIAWEVKNCHAEFCGSKESGSSSPDIETSNARSYSAPAAPAPAAKPDFEIIDDDDLPF